MDFYNLTVANVTDDEEAHGEKPLSADTALAIQGILQATLVTTVIIGVTAMVYLHVNRRIRSRIYGPLASGVSNLMMFLAGFALILVVVMQVSAITAHEVPCIIHSALSTSLVPICGTVFLLRAWVLVVQFARVHEQLRWLKLYQMSPKDRAEQEQLPLSLSTRIDLWITTHRLVSSPYMLVTVTIIFSVAVWVPSIVIEVSNECDHDMPNEWNDFNVWLFFGLALVLAAKLRGQIDKLGMRTELKISGIVFVVSQVLQMLVEVAEHTMPLDPTLDAEELEEEYGLEVGFAMWYVHTWTTLQLFVLVVLVVVRPAVHLLRHRDRFSRGLPVQQKLKQILNDRHLKEDFQDFLQREFSVENLTFHDSIKTLVKKSTYVFASPNEESVRLLQSRILEIYGDFVVQTGRFQVNLPNDDRQLIEKSINEMLGCEDLSLNQQVRLVKACMAGLTQAQTTIFQLMATDSLPRFLRDRDEDLTIKSGGALLNSHSPMTTQIPVTVTTMNHMGTGPRSSPS